MRNLLVVCTGNLCRSPMAAELFAARARRSHQQLRVTSAGVAAHVGEPPPEPVIALMARRGLDVSHHRAQQLTTMLASQHDLILVMDRTQQSFIEHNWEEVIGRVHRLGAWRDLDVADPYGRSDECYIECLACIEACVADWEPRLLTGEKQPSLAADPRRG